jgi:flagellar protein FliL
MARTPPENPAGAPEKPAGGRKKLIMMAAVPLILLAAGGGAYFWFHGHADKPTAAAESASPPGAAAKPAFVDIPEMSVTLPNNGQPRQLRIRLSLELAPKGPDAPTASALSPKVYDMVLTYLRTLTDPEIQGSLAIDRIRGDLYRRLELLLGPNVVRDVLITSLIVA